MLYRLWEGTVLGAHVASEREAREFILDHQWRLPASLEGGVKRLIDPKNLPEPVAEPEQADDAGDAGGNEAGEATEVPPSVESLDGPETLPVGDAQPRKQPSDDAWGAFSLCKFVGMKQADAAEEMQKRRRKPTDQGMISRWLKSVKKYLDSGGAFPQSIIEARRTSFDRPSIQNIDPAKLDRGRRLDPRTPRPSDLKA